MLYSIFEALNKIDDEESLNELFGGRKTKVLIGVTREAPSEGVDPEKLLDVVTNVAKKFGAKMDPDASGATLMGVLPNATIGFTVNEKVWEDKIQGELYHPTMFDFEDIKTKKTTNKVDDKDLGKLVRRCLKREST